MSMFGNSNRHAISALHQMARFTAFASPKLDDFDRFAADSRLGDVHFGSDIQAVLKNIYDALRGQDAALSRSKFADFLYHTQGEQKIDLDKKEYAFGEFFGAWVRGFSWDAVAPLPEKDVTKPLTNYFISSSHNTYLDGHQVLGRSTPQQYKDVLLKGGRCIEIDVWNGEPVSRSTSKSPALQHRRHPSTASLTNATDGIRDSARRLLAASTHSRNASCHSATVIDDSPKSSLHTFQSNDRMQLSEASFARGRSAAPKGEPCVRHGPMTAMSWCGFREVAEVIRDNAFVDKNDLPIIISFEMHADLEQQEVMVDIMREVWKGMLVEEPTDGCDPESDVPRLGQLRGKILIKVKRPHESLARPDKTVSAPVTQVDHGLEEEAAKAAPTLAKSKSTAAIPPPSPEPSSSSKAPIHEKLRALAVYTRSEKFENFEGPQAKLPGHIFSISEDHLAGLRTKHHRAMFAHNKNFFMRSYPSGLKRVNSSNHDPSTFWRMGVQMVSMNWQYMDDGMMLNYGMFADEQGWVLKPPGYRSSNVASQTRHEATVASNMDLTLTIFKAQNILANGSVAEIERNGHSLRTVTRVEIHTEKNGGLNQEQKLPEASYFRKTEPRKSDHPTFGEAGEQLVFSNIPHVVEELSFLL